MSKVPGDVIVLPETSPGRPDRWVAMNVFARTCMGVDSRGLEVMGSVEQHSEPDLVRKYAGQSFPVWDVERFSHAEGLLADPTRYVRDPARWPEPLTLDIAQFLEALRKHGLVIDDEREYLERFAMKTTLLDYRHFGNFHQQVGQYLMLVARTSPSAWWIRQKFAPDQRSVRSDNLYGGVQASYLERYFKRKISSGMSVLDVGCGTGAYAAMMAEAGAEVLGVDPSAEYIEVARKHAPDRARFEVMNVGHPGALKAIPSASADMIFISDALLFYFVPIAPPQTADIRVLLGDLRRILKPEGTLVSLEPHHAFYLMPWLGSPDRPFTVVSEYRGKTFRIIPTMSELIQAFARDGFAVTWMDELAPDPAFQSADPRAYHFAREFPVWQLLELKKI